MTKTVINWIVDRAEFSENETALFIEGVPIDQLPEEMAVKIKSLEMNENYGVLCRIYL